MAEAIIWSTALLAYGTFRLWHDNWSGPLKPAEIDALLARMAGRFEATGPTTFSFPTQRALSFHVGPRVRQVCSPRLEPIY